MILRLSESSATEAKFNLRKMSESRGNEESDSEDKT